MLLKITIRIGTWKLAKVIVNIAVKITVKIIIKIIIKMIEKTKNSKTRWM